MQRLLCLAAASVLAGCPPPPRYAVVDVVEDAPRPAPVSNALVTTDCGKPYEGAERTDELGRARVRLFERVSADRCVLVVAKPGYATVVTPLVQLCDHLSPCPATVVALLAEVLR